MHPKPWKPFLRPETVVAALVALVPAARAATIEEIRAIEDPEAKGRAIAAEAERRDLGFEDSQVELEMVLRNAHGQTSTRELEFKTLENPDPKEGDKTLVFFEKPDDVKGTALLTWAHIDEADDQWLYLPALKRVKRISSRNKSGPFMGSEFSYEDFTAQELEKYDYRFLREEACGELQCFVVERYPRYEHSGYTKQIAWIDVEELRFRKVDFYDRKESLLKTLVFEDYEQYLDQYWRARTLKMKNHQTGKSTDFRYGPYELRVGLSESEFRKASLKRLR